MKVGILGSSAVGAALGRGFLAVGHEVRLGARNADNPRIVEWAQAGGERASAGTFADTARFADVAVLATGWSGTENALRLAGAENLAGKVVIDVTNPLVPSAGGPPGLALGHTDSAGEQVQRWLPGARVVKAFNIVGNPHMFRPDFSGGPPDMLICGNDESAKALVTEILTTFGWPVIDIGGIEGARLLEPLAILWIACGLRTGSWDNAFKLLRK
jgi:predicted dinucleotide-binding enzyme